VNYTQQEEGQLGFIDIPTSQSFTFHVNVNSLFVNRPHYNVFKFPYDGTCQWASKSYGFESDTLSLIFQLARDWPAAAADSSQWTTCSRIGISDGGPGDNETCSKETCSIPDVIEKCWVPNCAPALSMGSESCRFCYQSRISCHAKSTVRLWVTVTAGGRANLNQIQGRDPGPIDNGQRNDKVDSDTGRPQRAGRRFRQAYQLKMLGVNEGRWR
jgi:hypothetical protein